MVAIAHPEETMADRIYAHYEKANAKPIYLARIGASSIGDPCLRSIWLSWRGYDDKKFGGRMLRLFQTGHLQEERIQEDLKNAGFQVWTHQEDGNQFTYTDDTGHFVAKLDGVIKGVIGAEKTPHDLEIKTHSAKSFDEVKKKGVEKAKPVHFYQMQAGMMYSKLTRALYVALCKNDEDYHIERVKPDPAIREEIQRKITTLVNATIPPQGVSSDGGAYDCRWCDMKEVCVGQKKPIKTCRSCQHVVVIPKDGAWGCSKTGEYLTIDQQRAACEDYEVLKC